MNQKGKGSLHVVMDTSLSFYYYYYYYYFFISKKNIVLQGGTKIVTQNVQNRKGNTHPLTRETKNCPQ